MITCLEGEAAMPVIHLLFTPELHAIPLQEYAYDASVRRWLDVDQPSYNAKIYIGGIFSQ